mgnify:CR=1 FL=1
MKDLVAVFADSPRRSRLALFALLAGLLVAPAFISDRYLLSVLILMLYFAFVGQAWNVMMGFAGQLSLGHSLYVGLGAYTAAALYQHFAVSPLLGVFVAINLAIGVFNLIPMLPFDGGHIAIATYERIREVRKPKG